MGSVAPAREQSRSAVASNPPPRESDAAGTERILAATEQVLREAGHGAVSLRQIADRAGVSKSLVLYHFASKEHLFAELQLRVYGRLAQRVKEAAAPAGSLSERARVALDTLIATVRGGNDMAVHAMLDARALSSPRAAPHVRRMRRELRALLYRTMREIFGSDASHLPVPLEAAADMLWAALTGLGIQSVIDDSDEELERGFDSLRAVTALAFGAADLRREERR